MTVILLRHAKARATAGYGDDLARTLDNDGLAQAQVLAEVVGGLLARETPIRIVASPALRCQATVGPLAMRFGIEPLEDPRLLEMAPDDELGELANVAQTAAGALVLCGHAPALSRLAQIMTASQGVVVPAVELALGIASFVSFEFREDSGRRLVSLSRYPARDYQRVRIVG
jgi:8-oxo-dGTP diphosphatase